MAEDAGLVARRLHVAIITNDLVRGKAFDEVSANEIASAVGVARSTFYRLFENKYDIPMWYQKVIYKAGVDQIGLHYSYRDGVYVTTTGVELLRSLLGSAARARGRQSTVETGIRDRRAAMRHVLSDVKGVELGERLHFQIDYCAYAEIAAMADWIAHEDYFGADRMADHLAMCAPRELHDLLDDPVDPWPVVSLDLATVSRIAAEL